ncbi:MAG: hypothetical protein QHI48_07285 [Bacteroidota bacterium]|nr:hypothetical protein [Bacteroidota bacterium]
MHRARSHRVAILPTLVFVVVFPLVLGRSEAQTKPKVYIVPEASQLNDFYTATGGENWTDRSGWPVPEGEQPTKPSVYGVAFDESESTLPDRILVTCTVGAISMPYNNLTGQMPLLAFSSLTMLDLEGNKLSGPIIPPQCPRMDFLYLSSNALTGPIPSFNYPLLKSLSLSNNKLTGPVPDFAACPLLEVLSLSRNQLSGGIPAFPHKTLVAISLNDNKLTGPIPDFAMPELVSLYLQANQLTGNLPPLAGCAKLKVFSAASNALTGSIPAYAQGELTSIDVSANQLTGQLPRFSLPKLVRLSVERNRLSGPLPSISTPSLEVFLASNNEFDGTLPPLDLPKLRQMNLENNRLEGTVPAWSFPGLTSLNLRTNRLGGTFGPVTAPELEELDIGGNEFDSLVALRARFPKVRRLWCDYNRLTFDDLLPNVGVAEYFYAPQADVPVAVDRVDSKTRFVVRVGGAGNVYQWFRDNNPLPGETKPELLVDDAATGEYRCRITNAALPDLVLWSEKPQASTSCIDVGPAGSPWLHVCVSNAAWQTVGTTSKKTASGTITINDILRFLGVVVVDTTAYTIGLDGVLSIPDVPLPGGGLTDIVLARGKYENLLVGDSGRITGFANRMFADSISLFGMKATLKELKFHHGAFPCWGITAAVGIAFEGLSASCGTGAKNTELELKEVSISRDDGVSFDGELKNLGLFFPGWCLNSLTLAYDQSKESWRAGAEVKMPLGTVGAGVGISHGQVDSIAWRLESKFPPVFVLGTSTIGISGFFGHVAGLTSQELDVELGGIFSDITSPSLYNVDVAGTYKRPGILGARSEARIMCTPGTEHWQIVGRPSVTYDFPQKLMTLAGDLKLFTPDGGTYYITASGSAKMSNKWSPPRFAGTVEGTLTLPKLSDDFPYSWLAQVVGFPVIASCRAEFSKGKFAFIAGEASIRSDSSRFGPHVLRFMVDMHKAAGDPDFFQWQYAYDPPITATPPPPGESLLFAPRSDRITIAGGTTLAVLELRGSPAPDAGTLKDPAGTLYDRTAPDGSVMLTRSTDRRRVFWTLQNPAAGIWTLERQNPAPTDTVFTYTVQQPAPFAISVTQQDRTVTVTWDAGGRRATDSVYVMLDEDAEYGDGDVVAVAPASAGHAAFRLSDDMSRCEYHVLASLEGADGIVTAYGGTAANTKVDLLPPADIRVSYNPDTHVATVAWTPVSNPAVIGYVVHLLDQAGGDSVVADLFREESGVSLTIPSPEGRRIALQSYTDDGRASCLSGTVDVIVAVEAPNSSVAGIALGQNYPNPFNPSTVLEFTLPRPMPARLVVVDLLGREVACLADGGIQPAGTQRRVFHAGGLPAGLYFARLETPGLMLVRRMLLIR